MKKQEIKLTKAQQKRFDNLKLTIELVPRTCWWSNVRSNLRQSQWDRLRKQVYKAADYKCEICGGVGTKHPVECHEIWDYDDKKKLQTLSKFIAICPLCHQVKHIGLTGTRGKKYAERAYKRFQEINKLTDKETSLFHSYFWQQWKERSKHQWKLDISLLDNYEIDLETTKFNELDRKYFSEGMRFQVTKQVSEKRTSQGVKNQTEYKIDKDDFKCPYCESKKFIRGGQTTSGKYRYKCKDCRKSFSSEIETTSSQELLKNLKL